MLTEKGKLFKNFWILMIMIVKNNSFCDHNDENSPTLYFLAFTSKKYPSTINFIFPTYFSHIKFHNIIFKPNSTQIKHSKHSQNLLVMFFYK